MSIESPLSAVVQGIARHYAQHKLEPSDAFADFHVRIDQRWALRRWVTKEVVFRFDGSQPCAASPGDQGFAVLERGLDWCISNHCHQYLIVRAAVLERGGRALLLPAPLGSGKSTLCAALMHGAGWRLLSDELALIDPMSGKVVPLPRPVRLANASIDAMRALSLPSFTAAVGEEAPGDVAYLRPPVDAVLRDHEPALPAWVVVPRYAAGAAAQIQRQSRAQGFMALVDNAINYSVHGRSGFATLTDLIDRCDCHQLIYGDLNGAVAVCDALARSTR